MGNKIKSILKASYNNSIKDRDRSEIVQWKIDELSKVLSYKEEINHKKLLDLGAGSGLYAKYLADAGLNVTCIDLSESMVNLCKKKELEAYVMDFYNLDFKENQFDIVWSLNTLLHVPNQELDLVLEGIRRVLKPSGLFYLGLYGGEDTEGIYEMDSYRPKRFFSLYKEETIQEKIGRYFFIEKFQVIQVNHHDMKFYSMIIRNTKSELGDQ